MARELTGPAKTLLESLNGGTYDTADSLKALLEQLEDKIDPDPVEINLASSLYMFLEKLQIVKHNLTSYISDSEESLGSKLDSLYERNSGVGTSKIFD